MNNEKINQDRDLPAEIERLYKGFMTLKNDVDKYDERCKRIERLLGDSIDYYEGNKEKFKKLEERIEIMEQNARNLKQSCKLAEEWLKATDKYSTPTTRISLPLPSSRYPSL